MTMDRFMESSTSYGLGILGLLVAVVESAQEVTIVASMLILLVRLIYDAVRLYRYIRSKRDNTP